MHDSENWSSWTRAGAGAGDEKSKREFQGQTGIQEFEADKNMIR